MDYVVDTAIIGAGPAGLSCAVRLQKANLPNLIVEKKSFPREKICGGLVTEKTGRLLMENFGFTEEERNELFCDQNDAFRLYRGKDLLSESKISSAFHLVKRKSFDHALANRYKELGGTLLENTCCKSIDLKEKKLLLSNGDTVIFKHLVAADGVLSRTREALGYKKQRVGFCVETQIPRAKLSLDGTIQIHFGIVKKGYAWIFPSGDTYCIGLCDTYRQNYPYVDLLKSLLASLGLDPNECEIKGAFIPYGTVLAQKRAPKDVVLIGDAAGFVDPITGEGLYFSMKSGMEAAEAILCGNKNFRKTFWKRMTPFVKIIRQGKLLKKIFYRPAMQKRFCKIVRGRGAFVGFFCDQLVSDYRYPYLRLGKLCRDYKKRKKALTRPDKGAEK